MTIESQLKEFIVKNLLYTDNGYSYPDDASFLEEGIVDSVGVLELVTFVEENFGLTVNDLDVIPDNFDSIEKLANYIRRKANTIV